MLHNNSLNKGVRIFVATAVYIYVVQWYSTSNGTYDLCFTQTSHLLNEGENPYPTANSWCLLDHNLSHN